MAAFVPGLVGNDALRGTLRGLDSQADPVAALSKLLSHIPRELVGTQFLQQLLTEAGDVNEDTAGKALGVLPGTKDQFFPLSDLGHLAKDTSELFKWQCDCAYLV